MFCTSVLAMMRQLPLFLLRSGSRRRSVTFLHHREALGDTLMISGLARNLKRAIPGVRVAAVTRRPELFYNNPNIDENRGWHLWRSGCTVAAKYSAKELAGLDSPHVMDLQWRSLWGELREARFLGSEGEPPPLDNFNPEMFLTPAELNAARKTLHPDRTAGKRRPVVLIGSGGKLKPTHNREWGMENYRAVVEALRPHCALFQISGETPLAAGGQKLPDLREIPVRKAAAIFAVCDAMLVQEGGLMHVARAVNAPCVAIYGGYVLPKQTGYEQQTNFWSRPECSPCIPLLKNCFHLKCMVGITPRRVLRALAEKIQERSNVTIPEDAIEAATDHWTPPPFVDQALLDRELLVRGLSGEHSAIHVD